MTLEDLQEVMHEENKPYWRLYAGQGVRGAKRAENDQLEDISDSCDLLLRRLQQLGDGTYTVCFGSKPNVQNSRCIQHTIKVGENSTLASGSNTTSMGVGIPNLGQLLDIAERLNNQGSDNIGAIVEAHVAEVRKDFEIERLKDKIKELETGGSQQRVIEAVVSRLPDVLDRLVGPGAKASASAGVLGTAGISENEDTREEDGQPAEGNFSIDQAVTVCLAIQELLPEHHINTLLWKLKEFIRTQPTQARQVISMLG